MAIRQYIKGHAVAVYFSMAFAIAWGGIFLLTGPEGLSPAATRPMNLVLMVFLTMLAGPSVAGMLLTAVIEGKDGLKALFARWHRRPVGLRWYAIVFLTTPLLLSIILYGLSLLSPTFAPAIFGDADKAAILGFGLMVGILAGFFEEIGWTGFAIPRLLGRWGVLRTGVVVGLLWGVWHVLADFWGNAGAYGSLYLYRGLLWVLTLTVYRMLMVWVYSETNSLWLAQAMHAMFTGGQIIFGGPATPPEYLLWYSLFGVALGSLAAIVVVTELSAWMQPPPHSAAGMRRLSS